MRQRPAWRLIVDGAADGAWNMAVDEAILERYVSGSPPASPTLRLYAWSPPALSLGRGQSAAGAHDPGWLERRGFDLVRRPTGGWAVLHEYERTYAVVARLGQSPFPGGVVESYERIAMALNRTLENLGIGLAAGEASGAHVAGQGESDTPVCFERAAPHEPTYRGRKIIGSAQLRRREGLLQHGSIPLRLDPLRLARAIGRRRIPSGFTTIEQAARRSVTEQELDSAIVGGFAAVFAVDLERGRLSPGELETARRLRGQKFSAPSWTHAR